MDRSLWLVLGRCSPILFPAILLPGGTQNSSDGRRSWSSGESWSGVCSGRFSRRRLVVGFCGRRHDLLVGYWLAWSRQPVLGAVVFFSVFIFEVLTLSFLAVWTAILAVASLGFAAQWIHDVREKGADFADD